MSFASRFTQQKSKGEIIDQKQKVRLHGKEVWNILHTFTNFLPDSPNKEEIETYKDFVNGILHFGTKFDKNWENLTKNYITENPVNFETRDESMMWMCNFHNFVNEKLEKDLFECTKENLAKRWGNQGSILKNNFTL